MELLPFVFLRDVEIIFIDYAEGTETQSEHPIPSSPDNIQ